jgi:Bacterial Ig-like domain
VTFAPWIAGRRHVVAFALAFALTFLGAAIARAGTYDVIACYGGPDNSWVQAADAGMAAYDLCPNNPGDMMSGIIARASVGSGTTPYRHDAYQTFTAPPGTSLVGMSFSVAIARWEQFWSVGFVAFDGNFDQGGLPWGCYPGPACGITPHWFTGPYWIDLSGHTQVRVEARCLNPSGCPLASTGQYPYARATIAIANVAVRVQDYTPPALGWSGGGLLSDGWLKGPQGVSFDASDNVGIRETHIYIDGAEVGSRGKPCDYTLRVPCPQGGDAYGVDTASIRPDGPHTVTAAAVDTAGNINQVSRTIRVDNRPPPQPQDVAVAGGEGWRSHNGFHLTWRTPAEPDGSPLTDASLRVCPAAGGECLQDSHTLSGDAQSVDVRVPQAGEYVARIWLRDAAGNEDERTAGPPVSLRFDDEAPELAFENPDASDPTRVSVRASDRVSGIAGGEIELRRLGGSAWQPLNTRLTGNRLVAYVDDSTLPDGTYEFRARAVDRAGNERSTQLRAVGGRMELVFPLREKTSLRAGVRMSKRAGTRLVGQARVRFGKRVRLAGSLADPHGGPIRGAPVIVSQVLRQDGARPLTLATLRTSASGDFAYVALAGPSRRLVFRYPGTSTVRPATNEVTLLVPAATSLRVSRRFALNGETVRFSGRLRAGPIPPGGKLVELQARVRGHWRTFATTAANARGVWRYGYRFDGTRGRQVYRFRARVPREGSYPYEAGASRRASVTVVGL